MIFYVKSKSLAKLHFSLKSRVLEHTFVLKFTKNQKFLTLIKDFYTGVENFHSKFELINHKFWIKIQISH